MPTPDAAVERTVRSVLAIGRVPSGDTTTMLRPVSPDVRALTEKRAVVLRRDRSRGRTRSLSRRMSFSLLMRTWMWTG